MKKIIALIAAIALCCVSVCAFADTLAIDGTKLTIEIPSNYVEYEPELEDGDISGYSFGNEEETEYMEIYVYEWGEATMDEVLAEVKEQEGIQDSGTTEISGISFVYAVVLDEGIYYVDYITVEDGTALQISFAAETVDGLAYSTPIMNTLK